jgi:WAS family protein 1
MLYISFGYYSFLILQEKLQFYHVKVSNKLLHRNLEITPDEGLGSLPRDLDSVSSLLLFNTSENPYVFYTVLECSYSVMLL